MLSACPVRPRLIERYRFFKRHMGKLARYSPNLLRLKPGFRRNGVRRIIIAEKTVRDEFEYRQRTPPVGQVGDAGHGRGNAWVRPAGKSAFIPRIYKRFSFLAPREQPVMLSARIVDNQPRSIRVAEKIVQIDFAYSEKLMDEGADKQPVGSGLNPDPFVGNGVVAGSHGVYGHDLDAPVFQFADADLDGI